MTRSNDGWRARAATPLGAYALCALMLLAFPAILAAEENAALTLDFADWLREGGSDREAEQEYLRALFLTGVPDSRAIKPLVKIYETAGEYDSINRLADRWLPEITDRKEADELAFMKGFSLLRLGRLDTLANFVRERNKAGQTDDSIIALSVAGHIYGGDYAAAKTGLRPVGSATGTASSGFGADLLPALESYRPKSETVAVALSAIIPGLGKLYAGQRGDALVSFLVTGSLAALTAYTANREGAGSWKPWAFGLSSGIFYSANLWGSSQAARRYNGEREKALRIKADEMLSPFAR